MNCFFMFSFVVNCDVPAMDEHTVIISVSAVVTQAGHVKGSDNIMPATAPERIAVFLTFLKKEGVGLLILFMISVLFMIP